MNEAAASPQASVEASAASLRAHHEIGPLPPRAIPAWQHLDRIPGWLDSARRLCRDPPRDASKAAEWFLDNEYQIRRAVRQVRDDMPLAFYRRLPPVATEGVLGSPRVYLAASGYFDITHAQPETTSAVDFMIGYQGEDALTLAELWAFPAMLRLVCLQAIVTAFSELSPDLSPPFEHAYPERCGGDRDPTEAVSRAIMALAAIERIDWKAFVEATSHVETVLRTAPDGLHRNMDFETRDRYRKAVEDLAEGSDRSEVEIAREAVRLSSDQASRRRSHAGWWLIDGGRNAFEAQIGYRAKPRRYFRRLILRHPGAFFATSLVVVTLLSLALPLAILNAEGVARIVVFATGVLLLMPASIIAVTLTNWLVTKCVPPRVLPKLDFAKGLPKGEVGAVIVPAILRDLDDVAPLLAQIERHWLTNPHNHLRYALLSDLSDADAEITPTDAELEGALCAGIRELNGRHDAEPFVLMHRHRRWNAADECWMGWERKRGKIEEFSDFLTDGATDAFPVTEGDVDGLRQARLVVTLDADTVAPPGAVHRLLGTLGHPLNRAEFDDSGERVVEGYTFIQPRIEISPEAGAVSLFTRLYTGDTAIDIYSRAVSDVYQDLFGEGIFTGKGAFDASAFHRCLRARVPENALVSHDLFEGLHGRVGLASDIVLYEGFPARYPDFAHRLHRWIRGDWQLLPWLGTRPPGVGKDRPRNVLSALDRWKILDNLRRSLIAPSLILLAVCGWVAMPSLALLWTGLIVAAPGSYLLIDIAAGLSRGRRRGAVRERWRQVRDHAGRWLLELIFMANEAVVSLDAIGRALWRLLVSRRHMLEWVTAAHVARGSSDTRARYWREMAGAPILAIGILGLLALVAPGAVPGALPLMSLWVLSPEIARLVGRRRREPVEALSDADRVWLRRLARRTWAYFETFAGPEDNWLPPDNFQTRPDPEIAHRSSPTNIGMQFLSSLAALDLGHAGLRDVGLRTEYAMDAVMRIERYRGHIVNWFDTRTLASLEPRYVSTVDSGNIAVALLTLREGLIEAAEGPPLSPALWDGFVDTLGLLSEALMSNSAKEASGVADRIDLMASQAEAARDAPTKWRDALLRIQDEDLPQLSEAIAAALKDASRADAGEIRFWLERTHHHAASFLRDLDALCPWLSLEPSEEAAETARLLPPDSPLARLDDLSAAALTAAKESASAEALRDAIERGKSAQTEVRERLWACAEAAERFAMGMDFAFLYDTETRTFFIGYNLSFDHMDEHHYDLLASEARLASYFAIAKGDVRAEHWFHMGRPISRSSGALTVLSWNGSMFEYLMPALLIRSAPGQLLGQSEAAAVDIQRRYGDRLGLPWGVSEAAFAARDAAQRYQYRAFGVAGLGMRQGLSEDYVVAPYASALALAVRPQAVIDNLRRLQAMGLRGRYGFYESVDFTPSRVTEDDGFTPVNAYMAHHQGMLLSAIDNALRDDILVRRFNRDPRVAAIDLLLHERVPWEFVPEPLPDAGTSLPKQKARPVPALHGWTAADADAPQIHAIGNGRLSVRVTGDATGSIWWHGQSLTRWVADPVCDNGAACVYLRDTDTGETWDFRSRGGNWVDAEFHADKASFHLQRNGLAATQEVCVAAGDDIEIRRITLVNHGSRPREIDVTSYAEPVLAAHAAHERHPAFSKLFVHSEFLPDQDAVLFTRRPRRPEDAPPVMLHRLISETPNVRFEGAESDRRALLGRHCGQEAAAFNSMTGSDGWTLDPVASLRARVRLAAGERANIAFLTIAAGSFETALDLADRYASGAALDWACQDAARSVAVEADRFGATQEVLADAQRLAGHLLRAAPRTAVPNTTTHLPGQPDLWGLGVSGDNPIVLVRIADADHAELLPAILPAVRWLRRSGVICDLLVLGTTASSYEAPIAASLRDALRDAGMEEGLGGNGGIHLHNADRITPAQVKALESLAALALDGAAISVPAALPTPLHGEVKPPVFEPAGGIAADAALALEPIDSLVFDNGIGGFAAQSGDYLIDLEDGRTTPVPWCNVLANDGFGTIVTEAGLGFTWRLNSGEYRLTPWSNDPVADPQGEALYLRDEETADVWTVTQLPSGGQGASRVTHRAGETVWQRSSHGLRQAMSASVARDAPVKLVRLRLTNATDRPRRITVTFYAEWQLGAMPSVAKRHVQVGYHAAANALIAQNGWTPDFADQVAFLTANRPAHAMTCDRGAFLGEGGMSFPEGLRRWNPWGRTDNVEDACAVYQVHLDVAPGDSDEVVFVLGAAKGLDEVETLVRQFATSDLAAAELRRSRDVWKARFGALQVETPDPAFDLMVNRWLPYQSFSSRILARAGFQQASGGVGFRDQLQDMMAFLISEPERVRAHILDCAHRQFEEGDVLHWWHPPEGRGVRTRCSDDMMWLVYATHRYVTATGDTSILREEVPFLVAPPLAADEDDRYAAFETGRTAAPLLDHCLRAMERGTRTGRRGLPLIGSGDWNDGMDRIGRNGQGESVWLAWFAACCGDACAELAERMGRADEVRHWRRTARDLRRAAEAEAWDGAWYRRAFDDNGDPWGSAQNEECRIDSIAQSWAVLSDAPNRARAEEAMRSAGAHLISRNPDLVRLLAPPFDQTPRDPGYIRAYPPGIRENGGQYTHAAAWFGLAFARLGDGDAAHEIFDLINPIRHASTPQDVALYRGEPYVLAADVGGAPPFTGRAGWTWYTGAAAWMWRLGVEGILGLELRDGQLAIDPNLPGDWSGYRATVRGKSGLIEVEATKNDSGMQGVALTVDGISAEPTPVAFPTDGSTRRVTVNVRCLEKRRTVPSQAAGS